MSTANISGRLIQYYIRSSSFRFNNEIITDSQEIMERLILNGMMVMCRIAAVTEPYKKMWKRQKLSSYPATYNKRAGTGESRLTSI